MLWRRKVKIAIVYNRDSRNVINLFGLPNRERIGLKTIRRITDALKSRKHRVEAFEGDKDLIDRLEEFMPRVVKGERPGLAFNLSYGIQGQARYTHVPSILEMVGIPYVGSGPLAHALALDKVVAKMIFQQQGLPTPDFRVVNPWQSDLSIDLPYPLIVKPKNEAVSFGVKIVENDADLRDAVEVIFDTFQQPAVVESFIDGREINVGLIGNSPPETFAPVELLFGAGGPPIYTYEDKVGKLERRVGFQCPADIDAETAGRAQELARRAFEALGCYDCARVDMRLDAEGIGLSRAPLVTLEFVLRALKNLRRLRRLPVGVLYYADEGRDCADSAETIRAASARASRVLVLRPGNPENKVVTQRRGWRRYRLHAEGTPKRLGKAGKKPDVLRWMFAKLDALSGLSRARDRLTVAASNLHTHGFPMLLPHAVDVTLMVSYGEDALAQQADANMREILGKDGIRWELEMLSDRPPMKSRAGNRRLAEALAGVAAHWEIPFECESSLWPSVAGLVPTGTPVVCGLAPVGKDLYQPHEAVSRISIPQRTLLLAEFLARES